MTNLIATASVVIATNWTGIQSQGRELGYLSTNHDVKIVYQQTTNMIQVKRELGSVAVWREPVQFAVGTNMDMRAWIQRLPQFTWPRVITNLDGTPYIGNP